MENSRYGILEIAHKHTSRNRGGVGRSHFCGCAFCERIFPAVEVNRYADNGATALCPYCGCDAVVPDVSVSLSPNLLKEMNEHYF